MATNPQREVESELRGLTQGFARASSNKIFRLAGDYAGAMWFNKHFRKRFTARMHYPPFNYPGYDRFPLFETGRASKMMIEGCKVESKNSKGSTVTIIRMPAPNYFSYRPIIGANKVRTPHSLSFYVRIVPPDERRYFEREFSMFAMDLINQALGDNRRGGRQKMVKLSRERVQGAATKVARARGRRGALIDSIGRSGA